MTNGSGRGGSSVDRPAVSLAVQRVSHLHAASTLLGTEFDLRDGVVAINVHLFDVNLHRRKIERAAGRKVLLHGHPDRFVLADGLLASQRRQEKENRHTGQQSSSHDHGRLCPQSSAIQIEFRTRLLVSVHGAMGTGGVSRVTRGCLSCSTRLATHGVTIKEIYLPPRGGGGCWTD